MNPYTYTLAVAVLLLAYLIVGEWLLDRRSR
jgi:hypothetical protein